MVNAGTMIGRVVFGLLTLAFCGAVVPDMGLALMQQADEAEGLPPVPPPDDASAVEPVAGESYVWRPVAIGGGGFITGMAQDARGVTRVIRTDVHGAYRWDARLDRWVQMVIADHMPEAYRVQAGVNEGAYEVAVAPSDPDRVYLAIKGRVLRSDDGGRNWRAPAQEAASFHFEPNSEFRFDGPHLAVDPADPDHLLLGTSGEGLWRSTDGGARWQPVDSVPYANDLRPARGKQAPGLSVWFAPAHAALKGRELWVASPGNGLFTADRRTGTFSPLRGGPATVAQGGFTSDGAFVATDWEKGTVWHWRGGRWTDLVAQGALPRRKYRGIAIAPDDRRMILMTEGGDGWCSLDRGKSWHGMGRSIRAGEGDVPWMRVADQSYVPVASIGFDAARPNRLWIAQGQGMFVAQADEACGHLDWRGLSRGIEEIVATDAVHAPGMAPVFAGYDFGIHVKPDLNAFSTTYGPRERVIIAAPLVDWTPSTPGFLVTNASDTRTGCCSEDGDAVMAGYSMDGGRSWAKFPTLPTPPGTKADDPWRMSFGSIAVSAGSPDAILWTPAHNRSPFYTEDRGRTWHRVALPGEKLPYTGSFEPIWTQRKTVAADRVEPWTFYLYHSGDGENSGLAGLWATQDGGKSWERRFYGEIAPQSRHAAKLRAVPGQAGHLFFTSGVMGAGDTALRRSVDGGKSWSVIRGSSHVDDVAFGKAARGRAYPALYLSGRMKGVYGIWRSVNNGGSWQRLTDFPLGRLDQVTVLEADKTVFGRVYIGYMGSGWVYGEPAPCGAVKQEAGVLECRAVR